MTSRRWPALVGTLVWWALCALLAWQLVDWGILKAVFAPDAEACQKLAHHGACWGVVAEKFRPLLLGHYPYEDQWRAATATGLLLAGSAGLLLKRHQTPWLWPASFAGASLVSALLLMRGGLWGLHVVDPAQWGGLPLTLLLFWCSLVLSAPLGIVLALCRRSRFRWLSWPARSVIELVRGLPLVMQLFMAAFVLPIMLGGVELALLWRVGLVLTLFSAAYLAEVVRGGLQTIGKDQQDAAQMLGGSYWQAQTRVVLPQALRAVLPGLVNHAIGLLKDTSLVVVVSLHELTGSLSLSLGGDPVWRPYYFEGYLFVGAIYAAMCLSLAWTGRRLERHWIGATAQQ
ncbi:amino acid ABC transporter permease [Aquabacterium sp.]|uniref:amino acid ABC transporter permease n=1 Tax=Aquabacterium sp. TaxID=1872578 RepID=UPI0035B1EDE5